MQILTVTLSKNTNDAGDCNFLRVNAENSDTKFFEMLSKSVDDISVLALKTLWLKQLSKKVKNSSSCGWKSAQRNLLHSHWECQDSESVINLLWPSLCQVVNCSRYAHHLFLLKCFRFRFTTTDFNDWLMETWRLNPGRWHERTSFPSCC